MLEHLRISRFAIIDELSVELAPGLNVITGETGAGKSILIQAVNLLMGGRASTDLIRTGSEEARVEALFRVTDDALRADLEAMGIELSGAQLAVHRIVARGGRGRVTINGSPATVGMLAEIGPRLIDISGQHEHQSLLDVEQHRRLLDAHGGYAELLSEMAAAWSAWSSAQQAADALAAKERDRVQREDYLRFQLAELHEVAPRPGEDIELSREREILVAAEDLRAAAADGHDLLYAQDDAVADVLARVQRRLAQAAQTDPALAPLAEACASARIEVEEVARALGDYRQKVDADPARLGHVEDRLAILHRLQKKYGRDCNGLAEIAEELAGELADLESFEDALATRRQAAADARVAADACAGRLHAARVQASKALSRAVRAHLEDLGMNKVVFDVRIESTDGLTDVGADQVEFLISPNPGETPKPLQRIASGGELSRVTLALKCVFLGQHPVSSYVFDEVDSGIGGAIAEVVGRKIAAVADGGHQVLCITHLAQIAVFGTSHYSVSKSVARGRTRVAVQPLAESDREAEIARMLGGIEITPQTRAHAREMLSRAAPPKPTRARRRRAPA